MRFMYSTDELFAGNGADCLHDVFAELDSLSGREVDRSPARLRELFESLPEAIRDIAHSWSLSDSVFRDEAFVYYRDVVGSPDK